MKPTHKPSRTFLTLRPTTVSSAIALALANSAAYATDITVNTNADSGPGSLRQAIADAVDGDVILFNSTLTGANSTITLTNSELLFNKSITINGDIDSNGTPDIKLTDDTTVTLPLIRFGGVISTKSATLQGLIISGLQGGGIDNYYSTLTVTNCTISGNTAAIGGGIRNRYGILTVSGTTLSGNLTSGSGGAISSVGGPVASLTVINSTLSGNSAADFGGGISSDSQFKTMLS